uniref:Reticulocalbin-2 n=1 Tax=Rhabditophanes sp. KR3021 TaxID=114890 RepID=A0AC35TLT7_9BILA
MKLKLSLFICLVVISFNLCWSDQEHVEHGSFSSKFRHPHDQHLDHEAIIGSKKEAEEFDELSADESKKRLAIIARRMDTDGNGIIVEKELEAWIYQSMLKLDNEEAEERFAEIDVDNDQIITWKEYVSEAFGTDHVLDAKDMKDPDDAKLFAEDQAYFEVADRNNDGQLSKEEFFYFQTPEHYDFMFDVLIKNTMLEKDENKDGKIDIKEYLGDTYNNPSGEWYEVEKNRFEEEYDKNHDGFLEGDELRAWLIPDLTATAKTEAEHLLAEADTDKNHELSIEEIVNAYKAFVGSEATNYGERLKDLHHEEL